MINILFCQVFCGAEILIQKYAQLQDDFSQLLESIIDA